MDVRISRAIGNIRELPPVGRPCRGALLVRDIEHPPAVRRPLGREVYGPVPRELHCVPAVVVGYIYLLVPARAGDEEDLCGEHTPVPCKLLVERVGEVMDYPPRVPQRARKPLAQDLPFGSGIEEPHLNGEPVPLDEEAALHYRVRAYGPPALEVRLRGGYAG